MITFKTAVIGCGMISKNHFKALKNVENAECVVACDIRPERAAAAAETYGIPHTETEYRRVLDNPEIDVVHICLPHYLHAPVTIEALSHGKNVLTEKPMATRWSDGTRMVRACDEAGVRLFVVKQNRRNTTLQLLKRAIDEGRFGKIHLVQLNVFWTRPQSYYDQGNGWRGTWAAPSKSSFR